MITTFSILDLVNFGLMVVIWLVQLIIYPSFAHYPADRLVSWHARYTSRISFFVVPLMLAQLALLAVAAYRGEGPASNGMLILVLLCWAVTFKFSVALHQKISRNRDVAESVRMLVVTNWPRTILWTAVFLVGLFFE